MKKLFFLCVIILVFISSIYAARNNTELQSHEFDTFDYEIDQNIGHLMPESERYLSAEERKASLRALCELEINDVKANYEELYQKTEYLNPVLKKLLRAEGLVQRDKMIEEIENTYAEKMELSGLDDIFEEERKIQTYPEELRYLDRQDENHEINIIYQEIKEK